MTSQGTAPAPRNNISIDVASSEPIAILQFKNGQSTIIRNDENNRSSIQSVHILTPLKYKDEVHIYGKNSRLGDYEAELLPIITPEFRAGMYPKLLSDEIKEVIYKEAISMSRRVSNTETNEHGRWKETIPMSFNGQRYNLTIEMW